MQPNTPDRVPLNLHDCIEQEKYVIVLNIEVIDKFDSNWHFLSKNPRPTSTVEQSHIKIFDSTDDAEFILGRVKSWSDYPNAFIHPVTVQTRVSIWGNWSIPAKSASEVK